ncbi:hypothetical protein [Rhodoferax sp. BLA1]|uniref:hypothetical protein n=1 Tax=Rhodoferax sp. BLA1 TaxID=2576062 RepID=UPI0015D302C5|nr:hypothetical protein [Rhodoferax sp. BLA1]
MSQNIWRVGKVKEMLSDGVSLSKKHWLIVLIFSIVIYLSLGLGGAPSAVYRASIAPAEDSNGPVKVVFYDSQYEDYLASGALQLPSSGWRVATASDSTTLTAEERSPPLVIYSEGEPITIGLLHYADAGVVRVADGNNVAKLISLRRSSESVSNITVGGKTSDVIQSGIVDKQFSVIARIGLFFFIFILLVLIAKTQLRCNPCRLGQAGTVGWGEVACFAIPLLVSSTFVLLAYWPGNVAYDASLQWHQAITRGNMDAPLGISATLFLRLFTHVSTNPSWVIVVQSSLSALGVAFILKELRFRGVPRWVAQTFSLLIAIQPQYPLFFTNLGKDALSAVGIIFMAWSLLSIVRELKTGRLRYFSLLVFIFSAVFSGMMRVNVIPATVLTTVFFSIFLFYQGRRNIGLVVLFVFVLSAIFVPKVSFLLSDEGQSTEVASSDVKSSNTQIISHDKGLPFGLFGNFYIYHLFSAAVNSGVTLQEADTRLFFQIAPRNAWEKYDCFMTDTTFIGVSEGMLLNQSQYSIFLKEHQADLAVSIFNILRKNPSIFIDRQVCISKVLWYIGYKQKPFQATSTLGYDNVTNEFKLIAGNNGSLISEKSRSAIHKYVLWSEKKSNFWFFWKPALVFYMGLFCALVCLTVKRDIGLLLLLFLPIVMICVLALVIPFPAYRYAYPATLLMTLLCTLGFVSTDS